MKKLKPKFILRSIPFLLLIIIGFSYYSCKKENHNITQEISDPAIAQAKSWYDITYPANVSSKSTTQKTNGITSTKFNFSQHISPNWKLAAKYSRFNKNVIEMPIDSTANFGYDLKNMTANKAYSNKKYNRSYFLLLNDGTNYQAYVMLIMADSTYVKNDLSKLNHNSYRKNDVDFTGMVLYFTPDGNYVNGYAYQNGQLILPASASGQTTQNIKNPGLKTDVSSPTPDCTDWYLDTYVNDVLVSSEYIGSTCVITGTGNSGGGSSPAPPPICTAGGGTGVQSTGGLTVNVAGPPPGGGTNPTPPGQTPPSNPNPGTGFPPPDNTCVDNSTPTFGLNNSNAQVPDENFDNLLNYIESTGDSFSDPFQTTFYPGDGTSYSGQMTEVYDANGNLVVSYFSPDVTSGPFQVGVEYAIGKGTVNPTTNVIIITSDGPPQFGTPVVNPTTNTVSYARPVGSGSSAPTFLAPGSVDEDVDDNSTIGYDNTVYPAYQQTTGWFTVANVINKNSFIGWVENANCLDRAKQQIGLLGYCISNYSAPGQTIQVYTEKTGVNTTNSKLAVGYLNSVLQKGIPVIVGVDSRTSGNGYIVKKGNLNTDASTDHFIVIIGMGTDSKGNFYQFYDSSTSVLADGTSNNNKLYYNSTTGMITGNTDSQYDNSATQAADNTHTLHPYILTQVRKSKKCQ